MSYSFPDESRSHWQRMAPLFDEIKPPLRPQDKDIEQIVNACHRDELGIKAKKVALLGATREYFDLPWREDSDVLAIDRSQAMLDFVWPGPKNTTRCCDWRELCLTDRSRDLILTDGGLSMLRFPDDLRVVRSQVARVLEANGRFVVRLYAPVSQGEPFDATFARLINGSVTNLSELKLRLWMSVQKNTTDGMAVRDIWNVITRYVPNIRELCSGFGWTDTEYLTLERYRDSRDRYYHPTVIEVRDVFVGETDEFRLESVAYPGYPAGEYCPTVVFRRT